MRTSCIILTTVLLAAGCSAATSAPPLQAPATPGAISQAPAPGTPYAKLRTRLVLDGWLPLQNPRCAAEAGSSAMCNRWLELQTCTADGQCTLAWVDASGQQLMQVHVTGMPGKGDSGDPTSSVTLVRSEQAPVAANATSAARCPSTRFEQFLPAFASQDSVRHAFTAPVVRSSVLVSDADGDRIAAVFVRGDSPEVFNVTYSGGAFHHVGVNGVDPDALTLDVKAEGNDTRDVTYLYGSSEGRGFRFTRQKSCWYLTGNSQPTGP